MQEVMTVLGVAAVIWVFVMILRCPDARENFSEQNLKEHRKSLILVISSMTVLTVLVAWLMSHVGMY